MSTSRDGRGAGPPPSPEDVEASRTESTDEEDQWLAARPGGGSGVAAAIGGSMLGLDQAIRGKLPPEIVAAEHQPERGGSGTDAGLVIEIPSATPKPDPEQGEPTDP